MVNAPGGLRLESVRAALVHDGSYNRLELTMHPRLPTWHSCDDFYHERYTSTVAMDMVSGRSDQFEGMLESRECTQAEHQPPAPRLIFRYDAVSLHALESYLLEVRLRVGDGSGSACVNAPLTPEVGVPAALTAAWTPIMTLVAVIIAALMHEATASSIQGEDAGEHSRITHIAECISYIQFIFFSSALSLHYPGFLQPLASRTSWSTLMLPTGMVVRDPWYGGVTDGLYEINGTFGGTYGMELMTQVLGGTITANTWFNTLALAAVLFALLTAVMIIGQTLTWTKDWFNASYSLEFKNGDATGMRATAWKVVRLFCSYFLLPLVAWTTYQLDHAQWFPVRHTLAASSVIVGIMAIIWWALWQASPRSLGYLLVGPSSDRAHPEGRAEYRVGQNLHAAGSLLLLLSRGMAIGGLQMVGMVQLLVMMAIEGVQIALQVFAHHTWSAVWSRMGFIPMIRIAVLTIQMTFLPAVGTQFSTKMILGYLVVGVHALVLIMVFLLPALLYVVMGLVHCSRTARLFIYSVGDTDGERPQIYGLRDLVRRPTNLRNQPIPSYGPSSSAGSRVSPFIPERGDASPRLPEQNSLYFRPPRPTPSPRTLPGLRAPSARRSSSPLSPDSHATVTEGHALHVTECGPFPEPSPLDPNVDYSFREADLYYTRPRRLSFRQSAGDGEQKVSFMDRFKRIIRI